MPWQAAPSLIIIVGAFNVAAGLIWCVDYIFVVMYVVLDSACANALHGRMAAGWTVNARMQIMFAKTNLSLYESSFHGGADWEKGRSIGHNQWTWAMENRDNKIESYRANKKD
eukprot:scaffold1199_cov143-Skeletonema_menzelii.AAC.1